MTLFLLHILENNFNDDDGEILAEALKVNRSLANINLSNNSFDYQFASVIRVALGKAINRFLVVYNLAVGK